MCSEHPAWERLISNTVAMHRLVSLIMGSFLDHSQVEVAGHLSRDDAQTFADVVNKEVLHIFAFQGCVK